jgi:hypothetical protein
MEFVQELLRPFVNELGEIREELRKPRESPQTVEEEPERARAPANYGRVSGTRTAPPVVAKTLRKEYPWLTSSTYAARRKRN